MQHRPPARPPQSLGSASTDSASADSQPASAAVRAQLLATEHWSLLATRSLLWTEAFTRAGIFLTVLSASVVALALVAQAIGRDRTFTLFALLLLPVVLFVGLATYARLGGINAEDTRLVLAMNRLRRGYLDLAPELEPYFTMGHRDDPAGLAQTLGQDVSRRFVFQALMSTPGLVGIINCVVFGFLVSLICVALGRSTIAAALLGFVAAALLLVTLLLVLPTRAIKRWKRDHVARFPS